MKSTNLKDLCNLVPVASAKVGNPVVIVNNLFYGEDIHHINTVPNVQITEYPNPDEFGSIVMELIKSTYEDNKQYVENLMTKIYERPVRFTDKLSDLLIKIKNFMNQTGKNIEEIVTEIRNYLGYKCSFNRFFNGKLVPVTSDRILSAYNAITNKKSIVTVENILYL